VCSPLSSASADCCNCVPMSCAVVSCMIGIMP
jgi:hypothetical protein